MSVKSSLTKTYLTDCRVDRTRTCTHLLPKQGTYQLVNYPIFYTQYVKELPLNKNPELVGSGLNIVVLLRLINFY